MKFRISLVITLALICIVAVCFTGCDSADAQTTVIDTTTSGSDSTISTDSGTTEHEWGMEYLGKMTPDHGPANVIYYRDIKTDVMYIFFYSVNEGGVTVMYDPETNAPLKYSRYKALYK